ncbi:LTA synthase family protein [Staphylococcus simulans]
MIQIILYLFIGLCFTVLDAFVISRQHARFKWVTSFVFYTFFINIFSIGFLMLYLKKPNVLKPEIYHTSFALKYVLFALVIGCLILLLQAVINQRMTFELIKPKHRVLSGLLNILMLLFVLIGLAALFFADWFIDFFGNITPEQFLFNLNSPIKGTSSDMTNAMLNGPILKSLFYLTPMLLIIALNRYNIQWHTKTKTFTVFKRWMIQTGLLILSIAVLVSGLVYGSDKLRLSEVYQAYNEDSKYIQNHYVKANESNLTFPKKKRNLIHIYLESMENSYTSKDVGGYMDQNLIPHLTRLSEQGVHFSNSNATFGGPHQTYGSSWSVAGMVNMGMGIPLKIPMNGNSYGKSGYFLPGAVSIGDVLHQAGYNQTVMFGADADFGGLTTYFTTHGHYKIFDVKYAREHQLIPKDYNVWWGFEDDKLYAFAKDEITRLSKEDKPFNFTMETADTHFPDGYLPNHAPKPHANHYANAISYSDEEVVKFIEWIQAQPFYADTTIVITGDHRSMDKKFFKDFNPKYERTIFNLILNPAVQPDQIKNRQFAPLDFYPTTLAAMGVEIKGNRLGLGTNLFSKEPTLIEKDGLKHFDKEISIRSNYYDREFVNEKKK